MPAVLSAIVPIFLLILLGYALWRWGFPGDLFWPAAARLTYYVLFPALLIESLMRADLERLALLPMAGATALAVLLVALLLILTRRWLGLSDAAFTSVFQGSIRPNTYIGLAGAAALDGTRGLALAAIAIAASVPLVNVLSVAVLTRYGTTTVGGTRLLGATARNPLIIACGLGIALNLSGSGLPAPLAQLVPLLGDAALPLGLLTVGAGLRFGDLRGVWYPLALASALKLLALPLLTLGLSLAWQVPAPALSIAVLFAALPCASTAYVLAQELGGDARLMALILTAQTPLAALTIPLLVGLG